MAKQTATSLTERLEQFLLDHARPVVSLPELVVHVIGAAVTGESLRRGVERIIARRLTAEQGRSGGQMLSRAVSKQIDGTLEAEMRGVTIEQRRALLQPLAERASLHLVEAAHALSAYVGVAADVVAAKEARDAGALVAARRARMEVEQKLDSALLNVSRALTGADE